MTMSVNAIVYWPHHVHVGDVIAYPARPAPRHERSDRDYLRVTRVEDYRLFGKRLHPEEWERDTEFVIAPQQLETGVLVVDCVEVSEARRSTTKTEDM